jgi:hypothetical protein
LRWYSLIVITAIVAGVWLTAREAGRKGFKSAFFKPAPPAMAGNVIDVATDMSGFTLKEMRVKVGEPVTVRTHPRSRQHPAGGRGLSKR